MANLRVDKITSTETFETTGSVQFKGGNTHIDAGSAFINVNDSFTVEAYVYSADSAQSSSDMGMICSQYAGASDAGRMLYGIQSSNLVVRVNGTVVELETGSGTIGHLTWHHTAWSWDGTTHRLFLDGVLKDTSTSMPDIYTGTNTEIGGNNNLTGYDLTGFISNFRIIKGKALYTENFKPPMRELEVIPGTVLLCCQSKTDASLEKTGKTLTVSADVVASELTPGLLTPVPKAGAGSAITGSVEFPGSSGASNLTISNASSLGGFTGDFTIEFWFIGDSQKGNAVFLETHNVGAGVVQRWAIQADSSATENMIWVRDGNVEITTSGADALDNSWHHHAVVRSGSTITYYIDGVNRGTESHSGTLSACDSFIIGAWSQDPGYEIKGHLSNVRIISGTALYTGDFIPPTRELKKVPGTVLLCCQDSNNPTQEATGKTISLNGIYTYDTVVNSGITTTPGPSNFTPQVGDDRKVTFEGVTKINSDAYFYLPTGDTVTRNTRSGRGLFGAGSDPSKTNSIDYVNINSTGNAQDFGDLTGDRDKIAAAGSSTRGLFAGGDPSSNTIQYVTLATTGNALNFGDLPYDGWGTGAASNNIRWLNFGDYSTNRISYVTISSTGDAVDFGDLLTTGPYHKGCGSSVRAIIYPESGGSDIQFLTFASTGNAVSFGDKFDSAQAGFGAASDSTRAIRFGGRDTPGGNTISKMGYVTIASTGNAQEFGDLTSESKDGDATSNSIRGVHNIGNSGSVTNAIDYVTIQTTGNAKNFGDLTTQTRTQGGTTSDSHGGVG